MRNRAFLPLIEQILMIAVFAIVSAVCIGCFASARSISLGTEKKDTAVILAQNTAESIKANGLSEKTVALKFGAESAALQISVKRTES